MWQPPRTCQIAPDSPGSGEGRAGGVGEDLCKRSEGSSQLCLLMLRVGGWTPWGSTPSRAVSAADAGFQGYILAAPECGVALTPLLWPSFCSVLLEGP